LKVLNGKIEIIKGIEEELTVEDFVSSITPVEVERSFHVQKLLFIY